ncbi:hypothetical protein DL546_002819 [Coniochaeta pulveracea]|uniref:Uncharacterized protein n=1 Tax=Coniochaeta pulveracea TaxID=177199 RepID=A0A420XXR0_9PEZI|nr:hypothetical protein DL546_002819 [Coniochaeta pulveracea]
MAFLKRKRSESEFSSSSSSTLSSPLQLELSNHGVSIEPIPYGRTPSYLPSRTMKRFRNSRPSDQQVHQHTLSKLYSARQQGPSTIHDTSTLSEPVPSPSATSSDQRSLHTFWHISAPLPRNTAPPPLVQKAAFSLTNSPTSCEDCGAAFHAGGDDFDMMEVDVRAYDTACANKCVTCGKLVCGSCSISVLGVEPRCLMCAGREMSSTAQHTQGISPRSLHCP